MRTLALLDDRKVAVVGACHSERSEESLVREKDSSLRSDDRRRDNDFGKALAVYSHVLTRMSGLARFRASNCAFVGDLDHSFIV